MLFRERSPPSLLVLMAIVGACASTASDKIYPALQEPYHRAILQNPCVNVYDVRLSPGQRSFYHTHTHDQIGVVLSDSEAFNQEYGKSERVLQPRAGSISYIPHSVSLGYTHRIRVAGNTEFRVVGVEFTAKSPLGTVAAFAAPDQALPAFPQGTIRRVKLTPGELLTLEQSLIIAESPSALTVDNAVWTLSPGAVKWVDGETSTYSRNASNLLILKLTHAAACAAPPRERKQ